MPLTSNVEGEQQWAGVGALVEYRQTKAQNKEQNVFFD
jgi:hypothetical protein